MNWNDVKNALLAAKNDYAQLFEKDRPISNDVNLLLKKLSRNVPSNADFRNPQAMSQWAQAAALNAPMMGIIGKLPPTKFSRAHDLAQKNAALPIEKGGLGLPPNNTAMDRAKAMGFDTETNLYHGTKQNIKEFNTVNGRNIYTTDDPTIADIYAMASRSRIYNEGEGNSNIIPILSKNKNQLEVSDLNENSGDHGWFPDNLVKKLNMPSGTRRTVDHVKKLGFDRLKIEKMSDLGSDNQNQYLTFLPKNIRSRFAAFDPMQKDSANILASILLGTSLYGNYGGDE